MKLNDFKDTSNLSTVEDFIRYGSIDLNLIQSAINGGIDFIDNCDTSLISVSFPVANKTVPFLHGLKRIPKGYLVSGKSANMVIFDGNQMNTITQLFLQSSAVGSGKVLVF